MGAEFNTLTFEGGLSQSEVRERFEAAQEEDRYENGHSYSGGIGMANGLRFTDREFPTYAEAEEWLSDNTEKWEEAKAVRVISKDNDADELNLWLIGALCSS